MQKLLSILTTELEEEHTALLRHHQAVYCPPEAGIASLGIPAQIQPRKPRCKAPSAAVTRKVKKFSPRSSECRLRGMR